MIVYEITAKIRLDLIEAYEEYMKTTHIPDLLATKYFDGAEFAQVTDGIYRVRYLVESRKVLEKYLETDVERLREDFKQTFPEGAHLSRQILEVRKRW